MTIINRDVLIVFSDKDAFNTYTLAVEPGDLDIYVPETNGSRYHDDSPCELNFSAHLRNVNGKDFAVILDIAHRYEGGYVETNWVSTGHTEVFTIDCSVIFSGAEFGAADDQFDFANCVISANLYNNDIIRVKVTSYITKPVHI